MPEGSYVVRGFSEKVFEGNCSFLKETGRADASFLTIFPGAYVTTVDGEPFSWYGSRMLAAPGYFKALKEKIFRYF